MSLFFCCLESVMSTKHTLKLCWMLDTCMLIYFVTFWCIYYSHSNGASKTKGIGLEKWVQVSLTWSCTAITLLLRWCVTRVNEFVKTFKQHDTTSECSPGGSAGNYIMFARATSGDKPNNRRFSPCSRSKMNAVMEVKGRCQESKCCFKGTVSYLFKMYYCQLLS